MERIQMCEFEEDNIRAEEFDPRDYCGFFGECPHKRVISAGQWKPYCMNPGEAMEKHTEDGMLFMVASG